METIFNYAEMLLFIIKKIIFSSSRKLIFIMQKKAFYHVENIFFTIENYFYDVDKTLILGNFLGKKKIVHDGK